MCLNSHLKIWSAAKPEIDKDGVFNLSEDVLNRILRRRFVARTETTMLVILIQGVNLGSGVVTERRTPSRGVYIPMGWGDMVQLRTPLG